MSTRTLVCGLLLLLCACGRLGVSLIPRLTDNGHDTGGAYSSSPDAGSCEATCKNEHGLAQCDQDSCNLTCSIGYQDCDGTQANGCEADLNQMASCGACGRSCENAHGTSSCTAGTCSPACDSGFADCDADVANGCETDLSQDQSCGACGNRCANAHGSTSCMAGTCSPSCDSGYADCDGDAANGCEANLAHDPSHCGSCSGLCSGLTPLCTDMTCAPNPCAAGHAECDNDPLTECETDLDGSLNDCGFCGNRCQIAHGSPLCNAGTCQVASCDTGYADCDGAAANGCEVDLTSTLDHCGDCAIACSNASGTTSCAASSCAPSCSTGFGNCDSDNANGCETALTTLSNCGSCGNVCQPNGGTPQCNSGVCTTVCNISGTFALKLSVPTMWPGTSNLSAGSGTFQIWTRVQLTQTGTSLSGNVVPCGQTVPDFSAAPEIGETYGVIYPSTIFDRAPLLPSVSAGGTLGGTSPGAAFSLGKTAWVVGLTMSDPINGVWPSVSAARTAQRDDDADGKNGVTCVYKSGGSYDLPPINSLGSSRASRGYIAARVVFQLAGTLTSCTEASGAATTQDIDSHTIGCLQSTNSDCLSVHSNYLDTNTPNFTPSASSYVLRKIADNGTCSDVRTALP